LPTQGKRVQVKFDDEWYSGTIVGVRKHADHNATQENACEVHIVYDAWGAEWAQFPDPDITFDTAAAVTNLEAIGKVLEGRTVLKDFGDHGMFRGIVGPLIDYSSAKHERQDLGHEVEYEDGDTETMSVEQVLQHLESEEQKADWTIRGATHETEIEHGSGNDHWAQCVKCRVWRFRWDISWRQPSRDNFVCDEWFFKCKDVDCIAGILSSRPSKIMEEQTPDHEIVVGIRNAERREYLTMWVGKGASWEPFEVVKGSQALCSFLPLATSNVMPHQIVDARPVHHGGVIADIEFLTVWTGQDRNGLNGLFSQSWESQHAVAASLAWIAYMDRMSRFLCVSQIHNDKRQNTTIIQSTIAGVTLAQEIAARVATNLPSSEVIASAYERQRRLLFIRLPRSISTDPAILIEARNLSQKTINLAKRSYDSDAVDRAAARPDAHLVGHLVQHRLYVTFDSGKTYHPSTIKQIVSSSGSPFFLQYDDGDSSWCRIDWLVPLRRGLIDGKYLCWIGEPCYEHLAIKMGCSNPVPHCTCAEVLAAQQNERTERHMQRRRRQQQQQHFDIRDVLQRAEPAGSIANFDDAWPMLKRDDIDFSRLMERKQMNRYCLCGQHEDGGLYVKCSIGRFCGHWVHPRCVGMTRSAQQAASASKMYACPMCEEPPIPTPLPPPHCESTALASALSSKMPAVLSFCCCFLQSREFSLAEPFSISKLEQALQFVDGQSQGLLADIHGKLLAGIGCTNANLHTWEGVLRRLARASQDWDLTWPAGTAYRDLTIDLRVKLLHCLCEEQTTSNPRLRELTFQWAVGGRTRVQDSWSGPDHEGHYHVLIRDRLGTFRLYQIGDDDDINTTEIICSTFAEISTFASRLVRQAVLHPQYNHQSIPLIYQQLFSGISQLERLIDHTVESVVASLVDQVLLLLLYTV
jgi:hypothetical protein